MPFGSLWLPVLVSAAAVWLASSVLHMVLKYHRADYKGLSNEDAVAEAMRKGSPSPGYYVLPYCPDPSKFKDPAVLEKFSKGPVAYVSVVPNGMPNMGKHLGLWLGFCLLVSFVSAYIARHTLSPSSEGLLVMRITGTVAFAAYGFGNVVDSIWKGQPWGNTFRALFDSIVYAVLTGLAFRLLWPD